MGHGPTGKPNDNVLLNECRYKMTHSAKLIDQCLVWTPSKKLSPEADGN